MTGKLKVAQRRSAASAVKGERNELTETVCSLLFAPGTTWDSWAKETGLSPATVMNLANGTTRDPRFSTVVALLAVADISAVLQLKSKTGYKKRQIVLNDLSRKKPKK